MLRRFNVLRRSTGDASSWRWFSIDVSVTTQSSAADEAFVKAWRNAVPNLDPPKTPLSFAKPRIRKASDVPSKLTVNFVLPFSSEFSHTEVDMVTIPATTGEMGILPGHVPTISELQPGVLSIKEKGGDDVRKYFVSSGFAFIHSNSFADIMTAEAVPIDHLDPTLVQKGLAEFTQKLNSATTQLEKAEAEIGVYVHSALSSALSG